MIDSNSLTRCFSIVFSSSFFPRQRRRCCQRCQHRPTLITCYPWWSPYCHPTTRCRRPEGEDCQCPTKQHSRRWRRWFQQHHAAYVPPSNTELEAHTDTPFIGLYTDESPGLKVDPVVVLVLSLVFIFSVVALHSTPPPPPPPSLRRCVQSVFSNSIYSYRQDYPKVLQLNGCEKVSNFTTKLEEKGR